MLDAESQSVVDVGPVTEVVRRGFRPVGVGVMLGRYRLGHDALVVVLAR